MSMDTVAARSSRPAARCVRTEVRWRWARRGPRRAEDTSRCLGGAADRPHHAGLRGRGHLQPNRAAQQRTIAGWESVASHRPTRGAASGAVRTQRGDGRTVAAVANLGSAGVNSPCAAAIIMAAARSQPDRSSGRQQTSLRKCMLFILRLRSAIFAVVTSAEIIPSRQRGQFAPSYIRIGEFVPELPRNPNLCGTPDPESHDVVNTGLHSRPTMYLGS